MKVTNILKYLIEKPSILDRELISNITFFAIKSLNKP